VKSQTTNPGSNPLNLRRILARKPGPALKSTIKRTNRCTKTHCRHSGLIVVEWSLVQVGDPAQQQNFGAWGRGLERWIFCPLGEIRRAYKTKYTGISASEVDVSETCSAAGTAPRVALCIAAGSAATETRKTSLLVNGDKWTSVPTRSQRGLGQAVFV
jgi:hypothetical protein